VWTRGIAGVVVCLVGVVWIAQGAGAMHGSSMSGHGQFAILGVVAFIVGVALLVWADRVRRREGQITD
jgi:protein-S-isoprenylcysteine O-methyltransferase Ste14